MIASSELIINPDGSIFHLHLKPGEIADTILLVGDPGRADMIARFFDSIEVKKENREFVSRTGTYHGKRITVLATGIGTDNIDIVVTELDALVNVDFTTREIKPEKKSLNLIRIGTSGSLQPDIPIGAFVVSKKSIGFDGLLNFYAHRDNVSDLDFERCFMNATHWNQSLPNPYVVDCSDELYQLISGSDTVDGINISAPGFYGPQGRVVRLSLADPLLNEKIEKFSYNGQRITNYEMESSAIYGLSLLLGHKALTICTIIANRVNLKANETYKDAMEVLIKLVLNRISA